jgi:hypothetical protein
MCKFFSCISDGNGKIFYLDAVQREETKGRYESPDSHTSIADYYGFKGAKEDKVNKYEFNPILRTFTVDQINTTDDSEAINKKCKRLNFKKIVPALIIHPLFNPTKIRRCKKVVKSDLDLLAQWDSVRASVRGSVGDSVWDSVWASVGANVWASVGDSVWDSVRDSGGDSVWASVRDSVGDSVGDSVWAYTSSFFDIKYKYDFSPLITLWNKGLIPSFDGKKWRLHGYKGKIMWEGTIKEATV